MFAEFRCFGERTIYFKNSFLRTLAAGVLQSIHLSTVDLHAFLSKVPNL